MTQALLNQAQGERLPAYAMFAAMLSAAGLPIYIHAPKFFIDEYGVSLAAMGAALFALRGIDVVQDPLLGRLAARIGQFRGVSVSIAIIVISVAMIGLFAVAPPGDPLIWFVVMLGFVFTAFSYLTIVFYAHGVVKADRLGESGHLRLARWRETGSFLGICVAAAAPVVLFGLTSEPFTGFSIGFAVFAIAAAYCMRREWTGGPSHTGAGFLAVLSNPLAKRLLLIAFVNAMPVAVTSTLFLFFVESRLSAPGMEGPLLIVFFLSAAGSAPVWGQLAQKFGAKRALLCGMVLAALVFGFTLTLESGDWQAFAVICVLSGAALGADMTLLPATFAKCLSREARGAAEGFGLWSFVSKLTLAFAALAVLPLLEASGFSAGQSNSQDALAMLMLLYAGLPCGLKIMAIILLVSTRFEEI